MSKAHDQLRELLAKTLDEEIDCDEFLARLPAYVEGTADELLEHHRAICPECEEEYQLLAKALGVSTN